MCVVRSIASHTFCSRGVSVSCLAGRDVAIMYYTLSCSIYFFCLKLHLRRTIEAIPSSSFSITRWTCGSSIESRIRAQSSGTLIVICVSQRHLRDNIHESLIVTRLVSSVRCILHSLDVSVDTARVVASPLDLHETSICVSSQQRTT